MEGNQAAADATPAESSTEELDATENLDNESLENEPADDSRARSQKSTKKPKEQKSDDDEEEEIAIGSVKAKVKKSVARAIKDLERGAQTKMQEAATERKRAAQLMNLAKTNPDKFFELTGVDADTFAESRLAKKFTRMNMTEEQIELADLKAEKEQRDADEMSSKSEIIAELEEVVGSKAPDEIKKLPKEQLVAALEKARAKEAEEQTSLDTEIGTAWKDSGLPKHKYFVQLMAATMLSHNRRNKEAIKSGELKPLQAKEAAAIVKKDFLKSVSEVYESFEDPKGILEALGPKLVKRIQEYLVARATGRLTPASDSSTHKGPGYQPASRKPQKTKEVNETEYREYMRSLANDLSD